MTFRWLLTASTAVVFTAASTGVATAAPGILSPADPLIVAAADGTSSTCTLGFLFTGPDGYARGVTAAHCGPVGQKVSTTSRQSVGAVIEHGKDDIALIDVATDLRVYGAIPGIGDVRGVITPGEINRTQPLMCKRGIASGLVCGYLTSPAEENYFIMSGGSVHGDSGSPVWAVDSTGALLAAGIVSGVMDDGSDDVYVIPIAPYMTHWGLTISR